MTKTFALDYIRQIFVQALFEEKVKNENLIGGDNELCLFSFYEQVSSQEEVDRYVKNYKQLLDQENKMDLIANGTLIAPENPSITNINQATIIPLSFTCAFRTTLGNRDLLVDTIGNLIERFKGRKVDIAELDNGKLFMVGTIANQVNETPTLKNGDFIGTILDDDYTIDEMVNGFYFPNFRQKGITVPNPTTDTYYYVELTDSGNTYHKIVPIVYDFELEEWVEQEYTPEVANRIPFPAEHNNFTKYQVSLSFDSVRCDEPRILNSDETCYVSFGGSATICSNGVLMGNQLTKLSIQKYLIKADTNIDLSSTTKYWLEPLEMPSGNNANSQVINKLSNKFIAQTHTDSLANTKQYSFLLDKNIPLLWQWFKYARFGIQTSGTPINYENGISPNMIYKIEEWWSCWGEIEVFTNYAKIIDSVEIENTESDVLSMTLTFQNQEEGN